MKPLTTIIVPVLNESDNIVPLVARIQKTLADHPTSILFVDDSSDNKSVQAVKVASLGYNTSTFTVRIFHRKGNERWGGLSGAVADGIKRTKSEQIIIMDGDLQHPPETIPAMLKQAEDYDIVVASRYCNGGSASGLNNLARHFVSRGSTLLTKVFFPMRMRSVSDPMTGFFLIKRSLVDVNKLRPKGFKILLEILVSHSKLSVSEVPLQFAKREAGESHGSLKQGAEFMAQLGILRLNNLVSKFLGLPKMIQFGAIGGSVFVAGMALLYVLVAVLGLSPLVANAIQLVVTLILNFELNKHITWRERSVASSVANRFLASRISTTVLSYLLFAWLISIQFSFTIFSEQIAFTVNYLVANIICLGVIMLINYVVSDRWVFANRDDSFQRSCKPSELPLVSIISIGVLSSILLAMQYNASLTFASVLAIAGIALFTQSSVEVWRMMYSYREPGASDKLKFPKAGKDTEKFCLIVPARHESSVLAGTLNQLSTQTHPSVDIITVICNDDSKTLRVANRVAKNNSRVSVMKYILKPGVKPSKPKQLNYVLSQIEDKGYTVVGIIDAEDSVQPELLRHIDAAFKDKDIGIVQGGVQLVNHDSSWYSLHNVLEYYRWFNSAMAFQADSKFMPLGGNTVFVRYEVLQQAGGWPVTLTEDCSLGVLLSSRFNVKTAVYYEPQLATREETPGTLSGLFHQRVRWNQGFFSEWRKGVWRELPSFKQRMLASYVLIGPVILAAISSFLIVTMLATIFLEAPVGLVMIMYIPLIPAAVLMLLNAVFLYDFGRAFDRKIGYSSYATLFVTYFAYQTILNMAAFWSIVRELRGNTSWYKTPHTGQHRLKTATVLGENFSSTTPVRETV